MEEAEPVAAAPAPVRAEKRRSGGLKWLVTGVVAVGVAVGIYFGTRGGGETVKQGAAKDRGEAKDYPAVLNTPAGTMFLVTGGKFIFGEDEAESPNKRQEVELAPYYVDATEVSNEQYARFVDAKGHPAPASDSFRTSPSLPVTSVTLEDARGYCVWAGKRLPSEQEWEKAARGVDGRLYPWGNQPLPNPGKLVAVDDYPERQSPFRALGMAGNAFEWTTTPFPVTEREIEDMQKALGGGATVTREWFAIKSGSFLIKDDRFFRLYMRRGWPANQANPAIGFRCVKDAN
ncbi:MAG: SUMF1/EgtB/PvdO family nonheme iron enzyme [Acidobacteria bacterium]|nr:SUMF1/EgtB/PvdO family nonheme iron enzyme [Acidobacteriota bacterium]